MDRDERTGRIHDLDVTLWVGKGGHDAVVDELDTQLESSDLVKVKFLRAGRTGGSTAEKAEDLAARVDAELVQTRGHTAVFSR